MKHRILLSNILNVQKSKYLSFPFSNKNFAEGGTFGFGLLSKRGLLGVLGSTIGRGVVK